MYKDTVTIYNLHDGVWIPAVLARVDVNTDKSKILKHYGENSNDTILLHIRYTKMSDGLYVGKYKVVEDFEGKENTIAFSSGNNFSIIRIGSYTDCIKDTDYIGGFYNNLSNAYVITSCAKYSIIPHFEITGK